MGLSPTAMNCLVESTGALEWVQGSPKVVKW